MPSHVFVITLIIIKKFKLKRTQIIILYEAYFKTLIIRINKLYLTVYY